MTFMNIAGSGHIERLQARLDFLEERIGQTENPNPYDKEEVAALRWVIKQIDFEERNVTYRRGYAKGQQNLLEFYQKTLKKAVHSGNTDALQFMLDKTNEWLEKSDENHN